MILAILQARMSSTRLPGKVLMPLAGAPMLVRQLERVERAKLIDRLVVATSDNPSDDVIAKAVRREGVDCFRGPLDDVQARFLGALGAFGPADHIVRLTADCPLIDPSLIDETIETHLSTGADYTSNTPDQGGYAKGLDVEVMKADAFRAACADPSGPEAREHVTWDLYHRPERFQTAWVTTGFKESEVRWTVDRPDDYAFVATVYDGLYRMKPAFTSDDVRAFVRARPDLASFGGDRRA
jgi:spore coat polysaccharide biosynthesis protein SpsF